MNIMVSNLMQIKTNKNSLIQKNIIYVIKIYIYFFYKIKYTPLSVSGLTHT